MVTKKGRILKKTNTLALSISLLFLITACNSTASNANTSTPSQDTILIEGLTYQHKDYGKNMDWDSAKKYCQEKGEKWRLPKFNELQKLTHTKALSNAPTSDDIFWTVEEDDSMPEGDYHLTISATGQLGTNEGHVTHSVLCVK